MSDDHLQVHFNLDHRLATCRPTGILGAKHAADLLNFLIPLERSNPEPFNRLLDLTLVNEFELTNTVIPLYAMARQHSTEHLSSFRTAIIAPEGRHSAEAAAQLYATLMKDSKIQVRVFDNASLAAAWLGVPEKALHSEVVHCE
jgi:hypothetical protein